MVFLQNPSNSVLVLKPSKTNFLKYTRAKSSKSSYNVSGRMASPFAGQAQTLTGIMRGSGLGGCCWTLGSFDGHVLSPRVTGMQLAWGTMVKIIVALDFRPLDPV